MSRLVISLFLLGLTALGNYMFYFAVMLFFAKSDGASASSFLSFGLLTLPHLFSPFVGVMIDKFNKNFLFIVVELLQFLILIALFLSDFSQLDNYVIYFALFSFGLCNVTSYIIIEFFFLPSLDKRLVLLKIYSYYKIICCLAYFISPLMAAYLLQQNKIDVILLINACTFLVTPFLVLLISSPLTRSKDSYFTLFKNGVAHFKGNSILIILTATIAIFNLATGGLNVYLTTFGANQLNLTDIYVGFIVGVQALFISFGSFLTQFLVKEGGQKQLICRVILAMFLLFFMCSLLNITWLTLLCLSIVSMLTGIFSVITLLWRQQITDKNHLGTVNAIIRTFSLGAVPLSILLQGIIIEHYAFQGIYIYITSLLLLCFCIWRFLMPKLQCNT